MNKEALEEHIKLLQATGASAQEMDRHHRIYAEKGWRGLDEQDLKWQLGEWQKDRWHFTTFEIAGCYARLGNKDQAFTWLNKGVELRSTILWMLDAAPDFASLRSDPRYAELKRKMRARAWAGGDRTALEELTPRDAGTTCPTTIMQSRLSKLSKSGGIHPN